MAKSPTREKIIEAAYVRFYQHGYNGTSVQNIVDMVGVQKGTFYNYFKSKERLALEALKYYARIADQVFSPPDTPEVTVASGKESPSDIERIRNQFLQARALPGRAKRFSRMFDGKLRGRIRYPSREFS